MASSCDYSGQVRTRTVLLLWLYWSSEHHHVSVILSVLLSSDPSKLNSHKNKWPIQSGHDLDKIPKEECNKSVISEPANVIYFSTQMFDFGLVWTYWVHLHNLHSVVLMSVCLMWLAFICFMFVWFIFVWCPFTKKDQTTPFCLICLYLSTCHASNYPPPLTTKHLSIKALPSLTF